MKRLILLLPLILGSFFISAQPSIEWQKSLGGSFNEDARFVEQTSDGGYIIAGEAQSDNGDLTNNNGLYDYWIVKLSSLIRHT